MHDYYTDRWRQLDSETLSAVLHKPESHWTAEERQDVLAWMGFKEDYLTLEPTSCCQAVLHDDVSVPFCCCVTWGVFYRDSQLEHEQVTFHWTDFVLGSCSIGLYVADFATDLWLASVFWRQGPVAYFAVTLVLVLMTYLLNGVMTLQWMCFKKKGRDFQGRLWVFVVLAVLLNLGPCLT